MQTLVYRTSLAIFVVFVLLVGIVACAKPSTPLSTPTVSSNKVPVITNVSFPGDVMALSQNVIMCTATDEDGDILQYQWSAEAGTIEGKGNGITWTAPDAVGRYAITVKVTDGKGGEVTQEVKIRVITNADGSNNPVVALNLSFSSGQPVVEERRARIWTTTSILCQVQGADAGSLRYVWSATDGRLQGKDIQKGTADRVMWIAPGAAGDYMVSVVVTDGKGNQVRGEVQFTVFCCTPE